MVMAGTASGYIPDSGDIVWLEFDPQAGREQAGHRPAIVLSPQGYNSKTSLMVCCPLTSRIKGYPFEVAIDAAGGSVALSDQIRNLDWKARNAKFKGKASPSELEEIKNKIAALIGVA